MDEGQRIKSEVTPIHGLGLRLADHSHRSTWLRLRPRNSLFFLWSDFMDRRCNFTLFIKTTLLLPKSDLLMPRCNYSLLLILVDTRREYHSLTCIPQTDGLHHFKGSWEKGESWLAVSHPSPGPLHLTHGPLSWRGGGRWEKGLFG